MTVCQALEPVVSVKLKVIDKKNILHLNDCFLPMHCNSPLDKL